MTQPNEERTTGNTGDGSDAVRRAADGDAVPAAVAPAAMGSGSATPIAAPAALAGHGVSNEVPASGTGDPDQEAFNSGEDELGGSDGPVGGTPRP